MRGNSAYRIEFMVVPVGTQEERGKFMRKLAIAMALSSTLLATPAFARDGAMYIGGEFGAMIVEDIEIDVGTINNAITLELPPASREAAKKGPSRGRRMVVW